MTLIKSISGIRGTIGGAPGESLTPVDIVKFSAAFGTWLKRKNANKKIRVVTGRDARKSGSMVSGLVNLTLSGLGIDIIDAGLATTPTVEMAVVGTDSDGGVIVTASHNPAEWNALKLLNERGEFLTAADGAEVLEIAGKEDFFFAGVDDTGSVVADGSWNKKHIEAILNLELVDADAIKAAGFRITVDCINSVGSIIIPDLLKALGVREVILLNEIPDGNFAHNPEPLPANLVDISDVTLKAGAHAGFVVDPDVDRLAIICEDGSMFGEEYTLVAVSDFVLRHTPGNTVSNMSSTRALKDVTERYGWRYCSAAVGEVNVVTMMKENNAVIGGEGNGGVIYPALHYGRDALAGIALFLTLLAGSRLKCSDLRRTYPEYVIAKKKLVLSPDADFNTILDRVRSHFSRYFIDERDGMKIEMENGWVQIRKSNTEPIMRVYAEAKNDKEADDLADSVIKIVKNI